MKLILGLLGCGPLFWCGLVLVLFPSATAGVHSSCVYLCMPGPEATHTNATNQQGHLCGYWRDWIVWLVVRGQKCKYILCIIIEHFQYWHLKRFTSPRTCAERGCVMCGKDHCGCNGVFWEPADGRKGNIITKIGTNYVL